MQCWQAGIESLGREMPAIDKLSKSQLVKELPTEPRVETPGSELTEVPVPVSSAADGTRTLLQSGFWITLVGLLALLATKTLFGGIGIDGPHTDAGWLAFMFALMGVPFGLMLLVLGGAKWLRNRNLARRKLAGEQ